MRRVLAIVLLMLAPFAIAQETLRASAGSSASSSAKPTRLALVIGNGAYKDAPLPNPLNDAADVAKALEASGFKVIRRDNASPRACFTLRDTACRCAGAITSCPSMPTSLARTRSHLPQSSWAP
jgi:hypothetical protein